MELTEVCKFCPKCSGKFNSNANVLTCSDCGFRFYINPAPCVSVIIEDEQGAIMLVKRKQDPKKGYWDLPGGFINPGENVSSAAQREMKEELGVDIEIEKFLDGYHDVYLYQEVLRPTIGIALVAKITSGSPKPTDDITEYKFFPKDEILKQEQAFPSGYETLKDYLRLFN